MSSTDFDANSDSTPPMICRELVVTRPLNFDFLKPPFGAAPDPSPAAKPADSESTVQGAGRAASKVPPRAASTVAAKRARVIRLSQYKKPSVEWLWPQTIAAGGVTLLVGEPGLGKSALVADIATRISRGSGWPDAKDASARLGTTLVMCSGQERCGAMIDRLERTGADLEKICAVELEASEDEAASNDDVESGKVNSDNLNSGSVDVGNLDNGSDELNESSIDQQLAALEEALASMPDCRLVVIDPLAALVEQVDGRRSKLIGALLPKLTRLARRHRVAIVAVAHLAMRATLQSIERLNNALGLAERSVATLGVLRNPSDAEQRLLVSLSGNFAAEQSALSFRIVPPESQCLGSQCLGSQVEGQSAHPAGAVEWGERVTTSLQLLTSGGRFSEAEQSYRDREDFVTGALREQLADGPVVRSVLDLILFGSEDRLYRAAKRLGVIKKKFGYGGKWIWMLPEHFPAWQAEQAAKHAQTEMARKRKGSGVSMERQAASAVPQAASAESHASAAATAVARQASLPPLNPGSPAPVEARTLPPAGEVAAAASRREASTRQHPSPKSSSAMNREVIPPPVDDLLLGAYPLPPAGEFPLGFSDFPIHLHGDFRDFVGTEPPPRPPGDKKFDRWQKRVKKKQQRQREKPPPR